MQFFKQRQVFKQRPPEETEEMKALDEKEKTEKELIEKKKTRRTRAGFVKGLKGL